jgi:hypothetical protein
MPTRKNSLEVAKKGLDVFSPKRPRGRPPIVVPSAIKGRADNYRGIFGHIWDSLWPSLSQVQTEEDVLKALRDVLQYEAEFRPSVALILKLLKDPKFPKRKQARINFLADSLASLGMVSPRRSRDICAEERAREKRTHHIIRYEYYVECSCGYEGRSLNHECANCGAPILLYEEMHLNIMR